MNSQEQAQKNLAHLTANPYPGRGIVLAMSQDGKSLYQIYWLMGRSPNSRNRVFIVENKRILRTFPADSSQVQDPTLVIYTAMRELPGHYLVTNGDQTDTLADEMKQGVPFGACLQNRLHEPDRPNWTPRISGEIELCDRGPLARLMSIRRHPFDEGCSYRASYQYDVFAPGYGWCITTYSGDGDPLPAFTGEPLLLPVAGGPEEAAGFYWGLLNQENRISLALKTIDIATGESKILLRNQYNRAP